MKYFFSHLTEIESINIELDKLDLKKEQKLHLADLIDSSLYHTVLDAIFSELNSEEKKDFINHLREDDSERMWSFLNSKIDNIEDKIKKAAEDLKKELHSDLKSVPQKGSKK